jgi:glyoxalase family protein
MYILRFFKFNYTSIWGRVERMSGGFVLKGIHHITGVAGNPQNNIDFYAGVLGLRLVKISVNQDDPGVYHFFYADERGTPGTDATFFPYGEAPEGAYGYGVSPRIYFSIPFDSVDYWVERVKSRGLRVEEPRRANDEVLIELRDPDGLPVTLVAHKEADDKRVYPWREGPVPSEHFIRGFHKAEIVVASCKHSGMFLEDVLGFKKVYEGLHRVTYETGDGGAGAIIDVLCPPGLERGYVGVGSVHHIAWSVSDDVSQHVFRERILENGFRVTPVIDRKWFKSIYFREPGHVLYEIATLGPGFLLDEPIETLGTRLSLPEWLEPMRGWIGSVLPRVKLPNGIEVP